MVRMAQITTMAAWIPKTTPAPSRAIHAGWKYATEKPPQVRHMLMMAETEVEWLGYFSRA